MKIDISLNDLKSFFGGSSVSEATEESESVFLGKRVIVRSRDAGVMYGTLKKLNGRYLLLENARIIWRWRNKNGGIALNDTAIYGVKDDDYSHMSGFNEQVEMLEACSIIGVSKEAEKNLDNREVFKKDN